MRGFLEIERGNTKLLSVENVLLMRYGTVVGETTQ